MATAPATVSDFKTQFARDFVYGTGLEAVRDADISRAFTEALSMFNPELWDSDSEGTAFLFLSAHFLVTDLQVAGGLGSPSPARGAVNRSEGVVTGKSVGAISVSFANPPDFVKKYPALLPLWETEYGKRYVTMLGPRLLGNISVVAGEVDPGIMPYGV